ncbi:hypothetical protein [Streptomyces sp. NPDC050263]|uniref:hypothetical protein n=1 Tax=Streptomyces sp. NPDC050263 TaxID=3155037 RepID=UPI003421B1B6
MSVCVGVRGAARVVRSALLEPAATLDGVEVTAIAAREPERAAGSTLSSVCRSGS